MQPVREFRTPGVLVAGSGALDRLGELAAKRGYRKALLVTDRVMRDLGFVARAEGILEKAGVPCVVYDGIATEPVIAYVEEGLAAYRAATCDAVVALGGGSVLDAAKAVAAMVTNPGSISDYKGLGKVTQRTAPLVAIPTTAGTGSEATPFTIITDPRTSVKMLIGSPFLLPDVALVDPVLTHPCPPQVTAATGIDALVHAIEAYVSVRAQPMSDVFALAAIERLHGHLRRAWTNGGDAEAREEVMLGALQAGIAFGNASVALVHGMSRPIGANFHVAHGVSNAALLAVVMEWSLPGNPTRYAHVARAMGVSTSGLCGMDAARAGVDAVRRLLADIRIPPLSDLVPDRSRFLDLAPRMADAAIESGSPGNNPRGATKEEIVDLYRRAYEG
jgi:alcohol dehydrogenase class IV